MFIQSLRSGVRTGHGPYRLWRRTRSVHLTSATVFSQAQITCVLVAQELNGSGLQRHHCAHENRSVIWSAMSSLCWSLPHLLTSSPPQHEARDLLQDDTVHRAPLPEPLQSTSSAIEPLSHANYESGRNSDSKDTEESWVACHTRTCNMGRKIWIEMGLPFLYESVAESMWRVMGWACDEKSNAVINSMRKTR